MRAFIDDGDSGFDGRFTPLPTKPTRRAAHPGHGRRCSSNPEIGCVCGYAEWASERDEARNAPDDRVAS